MLHEAQRALCEKGMLYYQLALLPALLHEAERTLAEHQLYCMNRSALARQRFASAPVQGHIYSYALQ